MSHYHVTVGLRGLYMPDSVYTCDTGEKALELAAEEVEYWNDRESDNPEPDPMEQYSPGIYYSKHHEIVCSGPCYDNCVQEDN